MQITLNLPDDIGRALKTQAHPELFVSSLVKAALQARNPLKKRPLGVLKGHLKVQFSENFKMTDEEFLRS